jgi:hypothetical protein
MMIASLVVCISKVIKNSSYCTMESKLLDLDLGQKWSQRSDFSLKYNVRANSNSQLLWAMRLLASSVFKCGRIDRICICGMQFVVIISYNTRYAVFVYMWVHAVYMQINAVNMRVHTVNMRVHTVNMRVHAIYNVIVECFFIILYLKIKKKLYICVRMKIHIYDRIPYMWYAVVFHVHEEICI